MRKSLIHLPGKSFILQPIFRNYLNKQHFW